MGMQNTKPGWDNLLEDLAGVNFRGLRTIWGMFRRPAEVLAAARTYNWGDGKWSPSVRVVLFLVTVTMALQFIWFGDGSELYKIFASDMDAIDPETPGAHTEILTQLREKLVLLFPLFLIGFHMIAAMSLRIWGKGTYLITRIRLYFCAIIPATFINLAQLPVLAPFPSYWADIIGLMILPLVLCVDALILWFGLEDRFTPLARIWRGILFASVDFMVFLLAFVFAMIGAGFWSGWFHNL